MPELQIPVFPFDSVAITLTTAVWVGVCVTVILNQRIGWTLSGLVVPGYLAPLLITRPITGLVILFEAVLTYLIAEAISSGLRRSEYWSSCFGRDRFFLIVIVSVLVRALFDGWLLPLAGQYIVDQFELSFNYRDNLRSFGLIVVALIANYFWKPGLRRGLLPITISSLLTLLVIKYVLVGFTNFNIGNLHVLYEDISTSLMASPKAYMIVITTAYVASWINLRYAWDFNGILIPALAGLLWYDPVKIVISGVECVVIYCLALYLLRLPLFRTMTVEGGTKLLFFFSICFVYRLILCHTLPLIVPGIELTEALGFGYLLTTLMAIKAYDKKLVVRMLTATAKVSMLGAVAGSLIGFAFVCGPRISMFPSTESETEVEMVKRQMTFSRRSVFDVIRRDKLLIYRQRLPDSYSSPLPRELRLLRHALTRLAAIQEYDSRTFDQLQQLFRQVNYELHFLDNRFFYLREASDVQGWGIYLIDTHRPDGLCVQVPAPLDEGATLEAGIRLFERFQCKTLAIAGAPRNSNTPGGSDVLTTSNTMFGVFHDVFGIDRAVMVRGYNSQLKQQLRRQGLNHQQSQVWIRSRIPDDFQLSKLHNMIGDYNVRWNSSPTRNLLRDSNRGRFVELFLTSGDMRQLIGHQVAAWSAVDDMPATPDVLDGHVAEWIQQAKTRIVKPGTGGYVPAAIEEMLYMDEEVVAPLVRMIIAVQADESTDEFWTNSSHASTLRSVHSAARIVGYGVQLIRDRETSRVYVTLSELDGDEQRGWGTFVFRVGSANPYAVEIPRPLFEFRSYDFGNNLFVRTQAAALLVAGAHPRANRDGSADISKADNRTNLYNLVRHILFREYGDRPLLTIQARAIQAPVDADIIVATDEGRRSEDGLSELKQGLLQKLKDDDLKIAYVDGSEHTAGYEIGIMLQATMVQISANKEVVSLWLSPSLRSKFREQDETDNLSAQFAACGLATIENSLWSHLSSLAASQVDPKSPQTPVPPQLKDELESYANTYDIVKLMSIVSRFADWRFERLVDVTSGQAFLLVQHHRDRMPSVMNLTGFIGPDTRSCSRLSKTEVESFVRSRAMWLEIESL